MTANPVFYHLYDNEYRIMAKQTTYTVNNFTPLADKVFVTEMDAGVRLTASGLILADDDMRTSGIRSRWARVWKIGPKVQDISVGEWVLVEHGRWTNGLDMELENGEVITVWHIDYPNAVLLVSDVDPREHKCITF